MHTAQPETDGKDDPASELGRDAVARFFRGLGDPTRLTLLEFLAGGERNVTECVSHVGLSQGRVSVHLQCLTDCGFATVRREGRYAYYSVADDQVGELLQIAESMVCRNRPGIAGCEQVSASPE